MVGLHFATYPWGGAMSTYSARRAPFLLVINSSVTRCFDPLYHYIVALWIRCSLVISSWSTFNQSLNSSTFNSSPSILTSLQSTVVPIRTQWVPISPSLLVSAGCVARCDQWWEREYRCTRAGTYILRSSENMKNRYMRPPPQFGPSTIHITSSIASGEIGGSPYRYFVPTNWYTIAFI
jgi:hypothetical protein